MATTIHGCLDIRGALKRPGYWRKLFKFDGRTLTTDEFRNHLCDQLAAGREFIPLGCPTPTDKGDCPGHADSPVEVPMRGELVPEGPPQELLRAALNVGRGSPCAKSKRGVAMRTPSRPGLIARGWNYPAIGRCDGSEACRRDCGKICVHAEQAVLLVERGCGAEMLHVKVVDGHGVPGGPPSCAECSKAILAAGVEWMWLWEEARGGWVRYTARDFHLATLEFLGLHTTIARAP